MSIDKKLDYVAHWDKAQASACWTRYEHLYHEKYGGALHRAMMQGNVNEYIDKECKVFARYARMWAYHHDLVEPRRKPMHWGDKDVLQHQLGKPLPVEVIQQDLHHVAQENKLRRLRGGDYFP